MEPAVVAADAVVVSTCLEQNFQIIRRVLSAQGIACLKAPTVSEVIAAIQAEPAMVVITEEVLAQGDVTQLIGCLNQQPQWSDIPVIFLLRSCRQFPTCLAFLHYAQHQRSITLLEMPLKPHEFISVVRLGLQSRQRQHALRDMLQRLQESNQVLENFTHTVAHELRNPLGVVTTSFDLLTRTADDPKQQKIVEMGLRRAKGMNQTLQTMLEYGKLKAQEDLVFESVDMNQVVQQAVEDLELVIQPRQAQVTWGALPTVQGSYELMLRLVSNLIKNAVVHNDVAVPIVHVEATQSAHSWQFQVVDNGPGIPVDSQATIFSMFSQGRRKGAGSGVGLALCRQIVEKHGGDIGVRSQLGQGSSFYFELPKGS